VPYAPGSLKAVAYNQGHPVAEDELRTAGKAARIVLSADRSTVSFGDHGDDVVTVTATAVDDAGVRVPDASDEVQFTVSGPARVVATDNGAIVDHESFLLPHHHLYAGRAIAVLRATGSSGAIHVDASASGLAGGDAQFKAVFRRPVGFVRAF
jgi:beta-galactosidase